MSSINPEMLKQLLSEFEEKQAVCREEINEITNQIAELEQRIESSKERLVSVARDREKIGLMKQRYQDGDWSSVLAQIKKPSTNGDGQTSSPQPVVAAPVVAPAPAPTPTPTPLPTIQTTQSATGDFPPISVAKADAPPPNLAPQPVIAPPAAQEFPTPFVSEPVHSQAVAQPQVPQVPQPDPVPIPDFSMPEAQAPNPFEQPQPQVQIPGGGQFQMEAPSWDPPKPYQPEAAPVSNSPQPANEGLFPFSQQQAAEAANADIPWAPPPTMSWESVGNHTFPNQGGPDPAFQQQQQQQPPAFQTPPSFPDTNQFGGGPSPFQSPEMQPPGSFGDPSQGAPQGTPPGAPPAFMSPPPAPPAANSQAVLTTAFDDEFDISDALRGEDDSSNSDSRDNDKKIKDALRGLFS